MVREVGHNTEVRTSEEHQENTFKTTIFFHNLNMKTVASIALLFATFFLLSEAVQVQDGEYFFSAESVKVLKQLLDSSSATQQKNPRVATTSYAAVCANPTLPQEFVPLCNQSGSSMVFSRLAAVPMDVCEICAFAACTGC